jgi:hypothetical protein
VAQLVEALRYKPEGRGFDSRRCHWNFSMTLSFRLHYGPGVDSASNGHNHKQQAPLATIVVVTSLITLYYYLKICSSGFIILNIEL